jgi:predicted nucleic acid-binding protein
MESAVLSLAGSAHKVFADTSYFFALLDPRDSNHEKAVEVSEAVTNMRLNVYTTWDVVVETVALLRYGAGFDLAKIFLAEVKPDLILIYPVQAERDAAIQLFLRRSRNLRLSLCDVMSYTIVSTRLDWSPCLTFDADFAALGLTILR